MITSSSASIKLEFRVEHHLCSSYPHTYLGISGASGLSLHAPVGPPAFPLAFSDTGTESLCGRARFPGKLEYLQLPLTLVPFNPFSLTLSGMLSYR